MLEHNLTDAQVTQLIRDKIKDAPMETIGLLALLHLSKLGIETNAENVTLSTEATIEDKRWECEMVVTYKEI